MATGALPYGEAAVTRETPIQVEVLTTATVVGRETGGHHEVRRVVGPPG